MKPPVANDDYLQAQKFANHDLHSKRPPQGAFMNSSHQRPETGPDHAQQAREEVKAQQDATELLNRLTAQIYDGCGRSDCSTSTCNSSRNRDSHGPTRSYTRLTARSIALAFATSSNPERWFCPHVQNVSLLQSVELRDKSKTDPKSLLQQLSNTQAVRNAQQGLYQTRIEVGHAWSASAEAILSDSATLPERQLIAKVKSLYYNDAETVTAEEYLDLQAFCKVCLHEGRFQDAVKEKSAAREFVESSRLAIHAVVRNHERLSRSFLDMYRVDETHSGSTREDAAHVIFEHSAPTAYPELHESLLYALGTLEQSLKTFTRSTAGGIQEERCDEMAQKRAHTLCVCIVVLCQSLSSEQAALSLKADTGHGPNPKAGNASLASKLREAAHDKHNSRPAIRLAERVLSLVAAVDLLWRPPPLAQTSGAYVESGRPAYHSFVDLVHERIARAYKAGKERSNPSVLANTWLLFLQEIFLRNWTGKVRTERSCTAGIALDAMWSLWNRRDQSGLNLTEKSFQMPSVMRHIVMESAILDWPSRSPSPSQRRILSYHFLFERQDLILGFRTACHIKMRKAFGDAEVASLARQRMSRYPRPRDDAYLNVRMKVELQHFLVLKVSRESVISDALDQLWQREARELFRPLRVRMGVDEGEIGHDLGGVQVEFFNLVCLEAFSSDRSLFVTDTQTHLSWFKSGSFEPLYKYELVGLLFGLAIYNGITLPVSFPLVFYRKMLDYKTSLMDLDEGWPTVAKGLRDVQAYDGDMQADLGLDYVYNFQAGGITYAVDMADPWSDESWAWTGGKRPKHGQLVAYATSKQDAEELGQLEWPGWDVHTPGPNVVPDSVDQDNRRDYVQEYATWILDHSVRPQFHAFAKGFYRVVDPQALRLLPANVLRMLVEGHKELDIRALEAAATYDGYDRQSPVIVWFWAIVGSYSQEKQKKLLEFVTASQRVPVNGASSLTFRIDKSEGNTDQLPGSSTCFGTLRLPEYESKEDLERKLDIALEHSLGFGQA